MCVKRLGASGPQRLRTRRRPDSRLGTETAIIRATLLVRASWSWRSPGEQQGGVLPAPQGVDHVPALHHRIGTPE